MSEWDGKMVVSTPGGQLIEMSLGEYVARKNAEIERLREEMQSAKADAWDDGYEAHRQMIEGIARKPSNPYR